MQACANARVQKYRHTIQCMSNPHLVPLHPCLHQAFALPPPTPPPPLPPLQAALLSLSPPWPPMTLIPSRLRSADGTPGREGMGGRWKRLPPSHPLHHAPPPPAFPPPPRSIRPSPPYCDPGPPPVPGEAPRVPAKSVGLGRVVGHYGNRPASKCGVCGDSDDTLNH